MKIIIFSILLTISNSILAKDIVLLTSLPQKDQVFEKKIEDYFLKSTRDFKRLGFNILIKHQADGQQLNRFLTSPDSHAVFWMSHGGALQNQASNGLQASAKLLDFNGDNVANIFQKIHPNIKFVGIMGCNSKIIMEGLLPKRDDTHYYIPSGKVSAKKAIKVSTKTFRYFYHRNSNQTINAPVLSLGHKVEVRRTTGNENNYKSLQVFSGNQLLAVLPKMKPNSDQTFSFYLPHQEKYTKGELKLLFSTGQNAFDTTDYFGKISLHLHDQEPWKLFSKPNGEPFGVNVRIFHFKSNPNFITNPIPFIIFLKEKRNE